MALKHKIIINVSDPRGKRQNVLKGASMRIPSRLLKLIFGDFSEVYLLKPGQTIRSVDVREVVERKV
ncbi:MAG: hypothetical protein RSD10_04870 [Anaerovoracaceae bacterium]